MTIEEPWVAMGDDGSVMVEDDLVLLGPEPLCTIGIYDRLRLWAAAQNFPANDFGEGGEFSGMDGIVVQGDIIWDAAGYYRRSGAGAVYFDSSFMWLPVARKNFEISYSYRIAADGGKHYPVFGAAKDFNKAYLAVGSWSSNFSNTIGYLALYGHAPSPGFLFEQYPPAELAGQLSQERFVWRTRKICKVGPIIYFSDSGVGPIVLGRCWLGVRGWIGLRVGPSLWIKDLMVGDPSPPS
jgi:hypothetical protein